MNQNLKSYRSQIDFIDNKILFYLRERMILSKKIGKTKSLLCEEIYKRERERSKL